MHLELSRCTIRPWQHGDAPPLARHANSAAVWANMRDRFPHPYTPEDAASWIEQAATAERPSHFAIVVEGEAAGGIGFELGDDVERMSAEIGYWLGEAFRGRGVMTEAVAAATDEAFAAFGLTRVFALPFEHNAASHRVLEKAGFVLEGVMRRSAIKQGRVIDQRLYARVRG